MVDEQTENQADDDGTREDPAEADEIATPKGRFRLSIGHPLRSLSQGGTSERSMSPTHAPRGTDDARKLSQRIAGSNGAARVHTTAPERVTKRSVVMSGGLI
jgi:hypothetical protein